MSKELEAFKKHFEANCSVKVIDAIEQNMYPHWKRLCFISLNCEDLLKISEYIRNTFSEPGNYSHLAPKIGYYDSCICLTVDVKDIIKKILK